MTYKLFAIGFLVTFGLAGCQSVVSSNPSNVLIQYDPAAHDVAKMASLAQEECQKHNKDAVYSATIPSAGWALPTASFRCE